MRLIDGDALIEKFNEKVDMAECLIDARTAERFATFCALADAVEEMPTVDAVPVRHGHWETNSDRPDTLICSVCKCGFDMWKHDPHNFCPNCGAKMDEKE